jgi:hypothetical protein
VIPTVSRTAVAWVLLWAASAQAWPVDLYLDLEAGAEKVHRLPGLSWVESEDEKIAEVEVLPTGDELLILGKAPGRTLVLIYAEGRIAVWRIRVAAKGEVAKPEDGAAAWVDAKKACPDLKLDPEQDPSVTVTVKDERCREALRGYFQTDAMLAKQTALVFELPALQAQLTAMNAGLATQVKGKVEARYLGAGLQLKGKLSADEQRKALWEVFRRAVGRVALDDRIESLNEKPAAAPIEDAKR